MSVEPAKKTAFVTPFWLDAFLVVCVVHLAFTAGYAQTGQYYMAGSWLLSFTDPLMWLMFVLPPYALLISLKLTWKESGRSILIVGGAILWVILYLIVAPVSY